MDGMSRLEAKVSRDDELDKIEHADRDERKERGVEAVDMGGSVGYIYSTVRAGNDGHGVWTCMGRVAETGNRMGGLLLYQHLSAAFVPLFPFPE